MRDKITDCLRDFVRALLTGAVAAGVLLVLFFVVGIVGNMFRLRAALVFVRGGLLVAGAFALFILAGVMLKKDGGKSIRNRGRWKASFRIFGLAPVLLVVAVVILAVGAAVDYWLYV